VSQNVIMLRRRGVANEGRRKQGKGGVAWWWGGGKRKRWPYCWGLRCNCHDI